MNSTAAPKCHNADPLLERSGAALEDFEGPRREFLHHLHCRVLVAPFGPMLDKAAAELAAELEALGL